MFLNRANWHIGRPEALSAASFGATPVSEGNEIRAASDRKYRWAG